MPVLRNPIYFVFLILLGVAAYVTYNLNLWGPMLKMTNAASQQALEIGKERLRDFLETSSVDTSRHAIAMSSSTSTGKEKKRMQESYDDDDDDDGRPIGLQTLDGTGRRRARGVDDDDDAEEDEEGY